LAKPAEVPGLAPDTPVSVAAPLLVRSRLEDLRQYEAAVSVESGEPDMEAVHDMRVAARRLRAAMTLFGRGDLADLEDEVKALQDALGDVRDPQVQRAWLLERGADGGTRALVQWAEAGMPRAVKRLRRAVRAFDAAVAPEIERASAAPGKGRLGGRRIAREVKDRLRTLKRRLAAARKAPTPRTAHRLRIAAKKLRYVAEVARPGFPAGAERVVVTLAPLQERLGTLHDCDVRIARLSALLRDGSKRERREARALLAWLHQDRARQQRALGEELERWRRERAVRTLRRRFTKGRRHRDRPKPDGAGVRRANGGAAPAATSSGG
jgi:CHAD domain-containing protein